MRIAYVGSPELFSRGASSIHVMKMCQAMAKLGHRVKLVLPSYDEHRLGLKPIIRRAWALKGKRPRVCIYHCYQWLYLYAFVHPQRGNSHWVIMPGGQAVRAGLVELRTVILDKFLFQNLFSLALITTPV